MTLLGPVSPRPAFLQQFSWFHFCNLGSGTFSCHNYQTNNSFETEVLWHFIVAFLWRCWYIWACWPIENKSSGQYYVLWLVQCVWHSFVLCSPNWTKITPGTKIVHFDILKCQEHAMKQSDFCVCETSKREVIFISWFVFVWCQHDWTRPCSADLKDGLSLMSTALQSFPTFSLCSNICSLFLWAACLKNCVSSNKTLWNGNLLMYTLQCRPVWKSLEEYIMDEKISSLMESIY